MRDDVVEMQLDARNLQRVRALRHRSHPTVRPHVAGVGHDLVNELRLVLEEIVGFDEYDSVGKAAEQNPSNGEFGRSPLDSADDGDQEQGGHAT